MNELHLLIPFALPPKEMARDLLRELAMPALALMLARASTTDHQIVDGFAHALPHESWLAQHLGLQAPGAADNSPGLAPFVMPAFQLEADRGIWFVLQPAHLHVARDHLVLTDPRQMALSEQDGRSLFDVAQPLFEEFGKTLLYGDAHTWFLRADDWAALQTSTPDAASGHNIDIWMPKGDQARAWRQLQNEIQMHWHAHPVNDRREEAGLKPVNSVWLWGGAEASRPRTSEFDRLFFKAVEDKTSNLYAMAGGKSGTPVDTAADILATGSQHGLLILDDLIEAAIASEWSEWLARFQAMEQAWFAPLLQSLKSGQLDKLCVTLSHNTTSTSFSITRSSLRAFWRAASLARLVP